MRPRGRFRYLGAFDLDFLRDGETVGSTGDGTGDAWITRPLPGGGEASTRVEIGQVVTRTGDGAIVAFYEGDPR